MECDNAFSRMSQLSVMSYIVFRVPPGEMSSACPSCVALIPGGGEWREEHRDCGDEEGGTEVVGGGGGGGGGEGDRGREGCSGGGQEEEQEDKLMIGNDQGIDIRG